MKYSELLFELNCVASLSYAQFHKKLLKNENIRVIGVPVPLLRKMAKKHQNDLEDIFVFPDEYYEVVFIKLMIVSFLPYQNMLYYLDACVEKIDNWAICDSFAPRAIQNNKEDFLFCLKKYIEKKTEFSQRFALVSLLHFYVETKYYDEIVFFLEKADTSYYYVHMAAAWLLAEIIIKDFDYGINYLQKNTLDRFTHNKAIQKARESFRLSNEQKEELKSKKDSRRD